MKEAGFESGLETTLSLDTGTATVGEPTAIPIQESLAKIGIKASIEKIPGANWRTAPRSRIPRRRRWCRW